MTKEEIIQGLYRGDSRAIKEAIKILEQEAFDEMRAEIEKLQTYKMFVGDKETYVELDDVLAIIDKCKAESEE